MKKRKHNHKVIYTFTKKEIERIEDAYYLRYNANTNNKR